jgi:hypothetical protein
VLYGVPLQNFGEEKALSDKLTHVLKKHENMMKHHKEFDVSEYQ